MTQPLKEFLRNFELNFNEKNAVRFVEFVGEKNSTLSKALKYLHAYDLLSEIKTLKKENSLDVYFVDGNINVTVFWNC